MSSYLELEARWYKDLVDDYVESCDEAADALADWNAAIDQRTVARAAERYHTASARAWSCFACMAEVCGGAP